MDTLEKIIRQRLHNAQATAKHFDENGYADSAEMWFLVVGILEAIIDEANAS
jgi:hypothetical protein